MKKILIGLVGAALLATSASADGARDRAKIIAPGQWQDAYENWHYAPAVKIDGRIYVSGVAARPINGSYEEGYRRAWRNIASLLKDAGASLDDIVEIVSYHTDLKGQFAAFSAVKDEFIHKPYPAWSAVGTNQLLMPDAVVEIRVIAHVSRPERLAE